MPMHAAPATYLALASSHARPCNIVLHTMRPHDARRRVTVARADETSSSQPADLDAQLLQDLERLKAREASQRAQQATTTQVQGGWVRSGVCSWVSRLIRCCCRDRRTAHIAAPNTDAKQY